MPSGPGADPNQGGLPPAMGNPEGATRETASGQDQRGGPVMG